MIAAPRSNYSKLLSERLQKKYALIVADTNQDAVERLKKTPIDLVFIDFDSTHIKGVTIIKRIREGGHRTEVLVVGKDGAFTGRHDNIRLRLRDVVENPYEIDAIENKIHEVFEQRDNQDPVRLPKSERRQSTIFENIVGRSENIKDIFNLIELYSKSDGTVLIQGESGTGKELVSKAIHRRSLRNGGPFVVINCAAIPGDLMERELFGHMKGAFTGANESRRGKIEIAHNGTVFLDDIDTLDVYMQAKLLRVIQENEFERLGDPNVIKVNVRFIASTNKDLQLLVQEDKFREDLYYRLNVLPVFLPPLRERRNDIGLLFTHFLRSKSFYYGKPIKTISENALRMLTQYDWPGNVRELENFVERLVAINKESVIQPKDILLSIPMHRIEAKKTLKDRVLAFEKECIFKELVSTNGNRKEAANRLGIHRNTLINKINHYNLNI